MNARLRRPAPALAALYFIGAIGFGAHATPVSAAPARPGDEPRPTRCFVVWVEHKKKDGKYVEPRQLSGDCNAKDPKTGEPTDGYPIIGIDDDKKKVIHYFDIPEDAKDPKAWCLAKVDKELKASLRKKPPVYPDWYPEKPRPKIESADFWHNHGTCIEFHTGTAVPKWFCSLTLESGLGDELATACAADYPELGGSETPCSTAVDEAAAAIAESPESFTDEMVCEQQIEVEYRQLGDAVGAP